MSQKIVMVSGSLKFLLAGVAFGFVLASPVVFSASVATETPSPYQVLLHSRQFVPKADVNKYLRSGESNSQMLCIAG